MYKNVVYLRSNMWFVKRAETLYSKIKPATRAGLKDFNKWSWRNYLYTYNIMIFK